MSTRVPYPAEVPSLPVPKRLQAVVPAPPTPEPLAPAPVPTNAADASPVPYEDPVYRRTLEANAPSPAPLVPTAGKDWKTRLKYGAVAAIQNMAANAANIPAISNVPLDGPENLLSGLGAGVGAAMNPQGYEEIKYRRETLPRYQEQEKFKAGIREGVLKTQKAQADIGNVQSQQQQHQATTRKTEADTATVYEKLPYARTKEELAVSNSQQDLSNKRQTGVNLALRPEQIQAGIENTRSGTELNKALTPLKVEGQKLSNADKKFEVENNPTKLRTDLKLKEAQTERALKGASGASTRVDTGAAKDKAALEWREKGEKEAKVKFFQTEYSRRVKDDPDLAKASPEEKLRLLERQWSKVKDKVEKEFIENKSLDNRTTQRNSLGTLKGADANAILYGNRR